MLQHAKIEAARALPTALPTIPLLFDEAHRLLGMAPELLALDLDEDDVRIVAGLQVLRRLAEEAVERLITLLDDLEPDPDLEPGDNEDGCYWEDVIPNSLGSFNDPDDFDGEPSLGWLDRVNQDGRDWHGEPPETGRLAWAVLDGEAGDDNGIGDWGGLDTDAEDNGDREPVVDDELDADLEPDGFMLPGDKWPASDRGLELPTVIVGPDGQPYALQAVR